MKNSFFCLLAFCLLCSCDQSTPSASATTTPMSLLPSDNALRPEYLTYCEQQLGIISPDNAKTFLAWFSKPENKARFDKLIPCVIDQEKRRFPLLVDLIDLRVAKQKQAMMECSRRPQRAGNWNCPEFDEINVWYNDAVYARSNALFGNMTGR